MTAHARIDEHDRAEVGPDAAWALFAENVTNAAGSSLAAWLEFHECPRGERMAALYGFGEVRP